MQFLKTIKKIYNALLRQDDYFSIENTDSDSIPFHIRKVGRLYPMLNYLDNQSHGQIKRFIFSSVIYRRAYKVGEHVWTEECSETKRYTYNCIWVHLGNDYFKLISKS